MKKRFLVDLIGVLFVAMEGCALVATRGQAVSCFPANPVTILGLQGRPIPNAQVTVVDYYTGISSTVYANKQCTVGLTVVPSSGILQFWGAPGLYQVTASGEGLTRVVALGIIPGSSDPTAISWSWSADQFQLFTDPGTLDAQAVLDTDSFAVLIYDDAKDRCAHLEITMASFPVQLRTMLIVWRTGTNGDGSQKIRWLVTTCYSTEGNDFCTAGTTNYSVLTTVGASSSVPQYLLINGGSVGGTTWPINSIVRMDFCREGTAPTDTWEDFGLIHQVRMEWVRQ